MADSNKSDVVGIGLERTESEQVINAQATRNALAKQFVRWAILEDTTPSVMNVERLRFRNTTATLVTAFDDGQEGQAIDLLGDGFTTIQANTQIATSDGLDLDLEEDVVYRFVRLSPTNRYVDGRWHQSAGGGAGGGGGGSGVTSFNARTGVVVPVAGDYPPSFIGAVPASHLADADPHAQYELEAMKGVASGYTPLDGSALVPLVHLPSSITPPAWITYHPDNPPSSPVLFGGVNYDMEFVRDASTTGGTAVGAPATAPSIVDRALRVVGGVAGVIPDMKGMEFACPVAMAFTLTVKIRRRINSVNYHALGPFLRVGTAGAGNFTAYWSSQPAGADLARGGALEYDIYTTPTARTSAASAPGNYPIWWPIYMQMQYDGANVKMRASTTGHADSFVEFASITRNTAFGAAVAPGRWGFGVDTFHGSVAGVGYCEWARFTA
jgi:hypothetical protein